MRKIRCHYPSGEAFVEAVENTEEERSFQVFTTEQFAVGEELIAEISFQDLPRKVMIRGIGTHWQSARPRLRIRAGGMIQCYPREWRKIEFLQEIAMGKVSIPPRRRHVRQPLFTEVQWRYTGSSTRIGATLCEISEGGALLLTEDPPSSDAEIIIELLPPQSLKALEIQAIVRNHSSETSVGIEFLVRDLGGVHRIREIIRRLLIQ